MQQVLSQSSPPPTIPTATQTVSVTSLSNLSLPPPPAQGGGTSPPPSSSGGGTQVLNSVTDLDTGGQAFSQVLSGGAGGTGSGGSAEPDPLTIIAPITPATQIVPRVQFVEEQIGGSGSFLFQYRPLVVSDFGVPGIDEIFSEGGNRLLWYPGQNQ